MKVSLNWLKDYIDIDMAPDELSHLLTMTGVEVDNIEAVGQSLDNIIAARILDIKPHPNADQLSICQIDAGHTKLSVVCGAPDLQKNSIVPLALPGTRLPNGAIIKESNLRGELSKGALLAEDELSLTDDHTGVMIIPGKVTPGTSLPEALPVLDWVLDLEITPNRPDCASVMGIAREIAAVTGQPLKRPEFKFDEKGPFIDDLTSVTILEPAGCPRYAAGIIQNIKLFPSPFWMRYRLYLSGIRPINNLVDATNYVMLEMGQPLHAFDYTRLKENRIVIRSAKQGETFVTLDDEARELNNETLMICDAERPVALAGIMGGLNSEISSATKNVLIESACFNPLTIRRTSKRLGLSTEASYRFERGSDIAGVTTALKRALSLTVRLAGGTIAKGIIDNYPAPYVPNPITIRIDRTNRLLGVGLSKKTIEGFLKALEMRVEQATDQNELKVTPPSFRVDISREVDLFEEIARMAGYENIPVSTPNIRASIGSANPEQALSDHIKVIMAGIGFSEIITYSFVSPESADLLNAPKQSPLRAFVELVNPLSAEQSVMRTTLVHGLLTTAASNISRGETDLKIFELGKTFIHRNNLPQPLEKTFLASILTGHYQKKTWFNQERQVDFYDIKGSLEVLLAKIGVEKFSFSNSSGLPWYDNDLSAVIHVDNSVIGHLGRISSRIKAAYGITTANVYLFELDIQILSKLTADGRKFKPFPKFPAVYRDISILVPQDIESSLIVETIKQHGKELIESVRIYDLFTGKGIDPSEKALAFKICYRSSQGTLDGEKTNKLHKDIIEKIRKQTGGKLREG
jgi:phenylalanyl-tRNA synthetase beta chain